MTAKEILDIVNQHDCEEAALLLEKILSEHLRGKVYLGAINKYYENLYFEKEFNSKLYDAHINPQGVLASYIERFGLNGLVKYLTEREDNERQ